MTIEDIAKKITSFQIKSPYYILFAFLIVTALLIPGIFNLVGNVEPSLEKVLPQSIEEIGTMNDMRTQFGADMTYLVIYSDDFITDVRNPSFLNYIDALSQKIRLHESVVNVYSLADEVKQYSNGEIPDSLSLIRSYPLSGSFSNADYSMAVIQVTTDTGSAAKKIDNLITLMESDINSLEIINPGSRVEITGFNAIDKATFEVIMSDFSIITLVSMFLVLMVVFFMFGSLKRALLPMSVVMMSLLWTMGIVGYLNLTITVVSMVSAAMILGLGIDFGIHVVHTYFEKRHKYKPKQALEKTLEELLRAMTGASLTTTAGFLALLFGVLPAMKILAIILSLGILSTLLGAVFLLPTIVYLVDRRNTK